jgi:hypothetical protein
MHTHTPQPRRQPDPTKHVVFGSGRDLGLVLTSDDPLDKLWLQIDADGDGQLGKSELARLMATMGRHGENIDELFVALDSDGSGDIDIGEFQDWYNKQPERSVVGGAARLPVRIASCGACKCSSSEHPRMRPLPRRSQLRACVLAREQTPSSAGCGRAWRSSRSTGRTRATWRCARSTG